MLLRRLLPAALIALSGCAAIKNSVKNGGAPSDRPQAEARQAVNDLVSDFESARAEPFFQGFDDQEFPNWEDFRYNARQFLLANRDITLDIVVDSVVSDEEETSVQAHWNRSYVGPAGTTKSDEGSCQLVFHRAGPALRLAHISGDSPFS